MAGMTDLRPTTAGAAAVDAATADDAIDPLIAGRAARLRHDWGAAYALLAQADRDGELSGDDLEELAETAFFAAKPEAEVAAKERAFKRQEADGNVIRAAYLAASIARTYGLSGKYSIASAWARRAERLIGREGETYAHGYLALVESEAAAAAGKLDAAVELAERAIAIGSTAADRDLTAYAQSQLGSLKIGSGSPADGLALMEEASIAAVNGELSPFASGVTACRMIGACRDLTDYRRASEWIEATERYCDRESLEGFPGVCRIHRAEVTTVSGAWERAEHELERATTELAAFNAVGPQAAGFYAIGDIRRLRGDFGGAEAALREAHARGKSPQPALALVRLAQGKVKAAATAIDAAVADETWDRWARARLLPAQVEIAIANADIAHARAAIDELGSIIASYPSPALVAGCRVALGRVLLAEGDDAGAVRELRTSIKEWREVGAPYEVARARALLARALRAGGDEDDADLELRAAIDEFGRLGARVELEAAERDLRVAAERRSGPQTARKTLMFTDIVGSTNLAEALGDEAWERLLRWHDDMLRSLVAKGGGQVVNSTGDGFFAAFDSAAAAVDVAIAIQRALRDQAFNSGFAPSVRIGLHTTAATLRGDDYSGIGVHVAARIGALAAGREILASTDTLAEAGDVPASEPRPAEIRGATAPVSLATVTWS